MNKDIVSQVQEKISKSQWTAEFCHPHRWKDEDMDKCLDTLHKTIFSVDDVADVINTWADEIWHISEDDDMPTVDACIRVVADSLAWSVLRDKDVIFPDSAIFLIVD